MCTLSWLEIEAGYELFFNRDESIARAPARAPARDVSEGVAFLAPVDVEAGGTWISVNAHGVCVALLNAAGDSTGDGPLESRGLLVRALAASASLADVAQRMEARDLERHRGFRLAAFGPGQAGRVWAWNGKILTHEAPQLPLASSSLGSKRAHEARRSALAKLSDPSRGLTARQLEAFHRGHDPGPGAWSACVHRAGVRTVSTSHVRVTGERVSLRYAPGPPCTTAFEAALELARVGSAEARPSA